MLTPGRQPSPWGSASVCAEAGGLGRTAEAINTKMPADAGDGAEYKACLEISCPVYEAALQLALQGTAVMAVGQPI
jgi:hypothetical protein